jgi:threonine dehydrogenase-like Zn-dependent dehydrogenase
MCRAGRINLCERVAFGDLEPGLQCGFCESTGGGWGQEMVVHPSQVVEVADDLTDEQAVLVEPVACAVHASRRVGDGQAAVIGAGALGLFTIAALRSLARPSVLLATAKHPEQRRWAKELGADVVCAPGELDRAVRSATTSFVLDNGQLTSGVAAAVDCVGSEESLAQAIRVVGPGGTVHMVGMPGVTTLDLTPVWQREVALRGVYAYDEHDDRTHDFATAAELIRDLDLGRLVSATYPLARYEDAVDHAAHAGVRGAVKVAFDLRAGSRGAGS